MPAAFQTVIPGCEIVPNYLNGDPAYPLTPFCMKNLIILTVMKRSYSTTCSGQPETKLNAHLDA